MADNGLTQVEIEQLVAWMDGELPVDEAAAVEAKVAGDSAWRQAHQDFTAVDSAMDALPVPASSADLAGRIVAAAGRERSWSGWVIRIGAPLAAAAAAAIIAIALFHGQPNKAKPVPVPEGGLATIIDKNLQDVPAEDRFIVQNLPMFEDYDAVKSFEEVHQVLDAKTLSALGELDQNRDM